MSGVDMVWAAARRLPRMERRVFAVAFSQRSSAAAAAGDPVGDLWHALAVVMVEVSEEEDRLLRSALPGGIAEIVEEEDDGDE